MLLAAQGPASIMGGLLPVQHPASDGWLLLLCPLPSRSTGAAAVCAVASCEGLSAPLQTDCAAQILPDAPKIAISGTGSKMPVLVATPSHWSSSFTSTSATVRLAKSGSKRR
eukprot:3952992-Pleurochrysis_carterae.AAC.1